MMTTKMQPTACEFLYVGHPVSMTINGQPVAYHKTWHVYGRGADALGAPDGPAEGPLGPGFATKAEAVMYATQVRCPDYH